MTANTYGRQVIVPLTNKSGGSVAAGDVVIIDTTNNDAFTTTTSAGSTVTIGVAQETIANNASGRVLTQGYAALVNVNASVTRGNYGKTHTVAKQATDAGASRVAGTFCQFLTGGTTPDAMVYPVDLAGAALTNPMTTKGDVIIGDTAGAPSRLAAGATSGMVLTSAGSGAFETFALPPGYEYSYVTYTDVSITGTTEGGAQTVAVSASIALDGSTGVYVRFYSPRIILGTSAGNGMVIDLYVDSTIQGRLAVLLTPASAADDKPLFLESPKLTPSNASHTFTVKAWRVNANATVSGGAGGTGTNLPGYIRVVKA